MKSIIRHALTHLIFYAPGERRGIEGFLIGNWLMSAKWVIIGDFRGPLFMARAQAAFLLANATFECCLSYYIEDLPSKGK